MQPRNPLEYLHRAQANCRIEGFGLATSVSVPCPFCAAPNFLTYRVLETQERLARGAVCDECGRGAKGILTRSDGSVACEIVQTTGPDAPDWLEPKPRRIS